MLTLHYQNYAPVVDTNITMKIDEDASLTEAFSAFVEITKIAGYQDGSWTQLITDIYQCCVVHDKTPQDYTVFKYASDTLNPIL